MTKIDDDFNPDKEIRRFAAVIGQPDKFAEVFVNALEKSRSIDNAIKEAILSMIKSDSSLRENIKELIREVEKEKWIHWGKKIGFAIWTIAMVVFGALANKFF